MRKDVAAAGNADEGFEPTFARDPLGFLDGHHPDRGAMLQTGPGEYLLGDPLDARGVLRNEAGDYDEHSDFFHTRYGLFEPQQARLEIRRETRALLRAHLQARPPGDVQAFVTAQLPAASDWPDAGNRLVYRYLSPILLATDSPASLRGLLDRIVERAVLAGAKARQPRWRRMLLQFDTTLRLSSAIEARQAQADAPPRDLLDVVARAGARWIAPGQRLDELTEVYLSLLFAVAGSVGFVLAWALYLSATHPEREAPPEWRVQEALRLWPVAWQLGRHPATAHRVSGVEVGPADEVVVCPYLVHRHPAYWDRPTAFEPGRWAAPEAWRNPAFIPFGHGPHRCVAADLATGLVGEMLGAILGPHAISVEIRDPQPTVAAAMAPPPFRLAMAVRA